MSVHGNGEGSSHDSSHGSRLKLKSDRKKKSKMSFAEKLKSALFKKRLQKKAGEKSLAEQINFGGKNK